MNDHSGDEVSFDDAIAIALARAVDAGPPSAAVKERLMARVRQAAAVPGGFEFRFGSDDDWQPHPVPGIRMKVLSVNRQRGIATLLLDVAPGAVFPAHHHGADEECYVISGTLIACGQTIGPGDFHHADGGSDHDELRTTTGCRVLLVVDPEGYVPGYAAETPRR